MNPEHLDSFKYIGGVLSPAVFHHRFLNAGFYKMVLDKKMNLKDLEVVGSELYNGPTWMLCVLVVVVVIVVFD